MYQVIEMYGDNEPWWFLENWEKDIVDKHYFETLDTAVLFYQTRFNQLEREYDDYKKNNNYLTAFWNPQEERWCEECDDNLQQFWGLALLKDFRSIEEFQIQATSDRCRKRIASNCCKSTNTEK